MLAEASALQLELLLPFFRKKRAVTPAHCVHCWDSRAAAGPAPGVFMATLSLPCQAWALLTRDPKAVCVHVPAHRAVTSHQQHAEGSPVPSSTYSTCEHPRFQSFFQRLHVEQCKARSDPHSALKLLRLEAQQGYEAMELGSVSTALRKHAVSMADSHGCSSLCSEFHPYSSSATEQEGTFVAVEKGLRFLTLQDKWFTTKGK